MFRVSDRRRFLSYIPQGRELLLILPVFVGLAAVLYSTRRRIEQQRESATPEKGREQKEYLDEHDRREIFQDIDERDDRGNDGTTSTAVVPPARQGKPEQNQSSSSPEKVLKKAALSKLTDSSFEQQLKSYIKIKSYVDRIKDAGGLPSSRRLSSVVENDLLAVMMKVVLNNPKTTEIVINGDIKFSQIRTDHLLEFTESIRMNLFLKKLHLIKVDLDDTFLSSLTRSIESNIVLEEIILTDNDFTNDALVEFCLAMESNSTLVKVDLRRQRSPIKQTSEDKVLASLKKNNTLQEFKIDFEAKRLASHLLDSNLKKNQKSRCSPDYNTLIFQLLENEAIRAEQLHEQRKIEREHEYGDDNLEWDYLYELSELAQKYRLTNVVMSSTVLDLKVQESTIEDSLKNMVRYTDDGAFLTKQFISNCLKDANDGTLTFAFQSQAKMFKRFPVGDQRRRFISERFADALLAHPRQKEITALNMANCACGDEWLAHLCNRCEADPTLLPRLHVLNLETNYINEDGVVALSECLANRNTWPYLQVLRLENQRSLLSSKAELALAKALCDNFSIIRFSLRIRNLWERNQINKYISRNLDYTRQARVKQAIKMGTHVDRSRNEMELFFDTITVNDPSIQDVDLVGNQLFLTLSAEEIVKAGASFARNKRIRQIKMIMLNLDCNFAIALGKALESNNTVEKIILDSNSIAGPGIKAIFSGLSKNRSVQELQIRHQNKVMTTSEEEELAGLLAENTTLCRIGLDLRSSRAQMDLDRKIKTNADTRRKTQYKNSPGKKQSKGKMQAFFEKIAEDNPAIATVELIGDQVFMAMKSEDKLQAARSFANNTFVNEVKMCNLKLDNAFAVEFGKAVVSSSITKLNLENNSIGSDGIIAIIEGIGKNTSITEASIRFQSKQLASSDEVKVPGLLASNTTLTKLGIDLRHFLAKRELDNKLAENLDLARKRRVEAQNSKTNDV